MTRSSHSVAALSLRFAIEGHHQAEKDQMERQSAFACWPDQTDVNEVGDDRILDGRITLFVRLDVLNQNGQIPRLALFAEVEIKLTTEHLDVHVLSPSCVRPYSSMEYPSGT